MAKQKTSTYMESELLHVGVSRVVKLESNSGCFSKVRYERCKNFTEYKSWKSGGLDCIVGTLYDT
jgi:hypothetical protein